MSLNGNASALRVGVIGLGYFGRHHYRILSKMKDVALTAVSDINPQRIEEVIFNLSAQTDQHQGDVVPNRCSTDYRQILPLIDAVVIATPTSAHCPIALDCLRADKHVFIEKPITATLEEADLIIQEAHNRGLKTQVGHVERYNPVLVRAQALIDTPLFIETERLSPLIDRAFNIDVTLDLLIHDVDIVLSIARSKMKAVRAVGARVLTEKIDVARAWIEFDNGLNAILTTGRLSPDKRRFIKVFQRDVSLSLDLHNITLNRHVLEGMSIKSEEVEVDRFEPLERELMDFVKCVRSDKEPPVTATEARNALELTILINNAIKENKAYESLMI
ncbi:MAG: Gfo/Idh/MocA family oxidoreductase [Nitrospirae bacterium]|nr:Gfo/Idh/MocA family oxidoreductase [Nitrospirota bacterium]